MKGRPTIYNQSIADEICARLADGESLRSICNSENMPNERTVRGWALDDTHPFFPQYAKSRNLGYLKMADELLDISDDGTNDWMVRRDKDDEQIGWRENGEAIARSRLRVDTRKWLLSKCLPKVYGDKTTTEISGPNGGPIELVDKLELARWIAARLMGAVVDEPKQIDAAG